MVAAPGPWRFDRLGWSACAGAGGVELLLAMQFRLRHVLGALGRNSNDLVFHLFTDSAYILPTHNPRVRQAFQRVLTERQVVLHLNSEVTQVSERAIKTRDGTLMEMDEIVWVTQAGGAAWLRQTGLALDADGFIQVNDQLQSISDPAVFAAGDIAAFTSRPLPKAGVFAVRMGPVLAHNLSAALGAGSARAYAPQRRYLALLSTADGRAVASWGRLSVHGRWVWRWKDHIDRGFLQRFSLTRPPPATSTSHPLPGDTP